MEEEEDDVDDEARKAASTEIPITPGAKYRARIDASPDATWEAVSDASLFSTFAPNVRTSLRSFSSSGGVSTYRLASDCRDELILCANALRGEIFLEVVLLPPKKGKISSNSSVSSSKTSDNRRGYK